MQLKVIELLREAERRRLYAARGYRSLFEFCIRELGYSEASAYRRISAMRLIRDVPAAGEKLAAGTVNLGILTSVQNFIQAEVRTSRKTFSSEEKRALVTSLENKTAKETEKILAALSPSALPRERERPLTPEETEIRFVADAPLKGKLDKLKDLNSHRDPSRSYRNLFDWLSDIGLKQADPLMTKPRTSASARPASPNTPQPSAPATSAPVTGRLADPPAAPSSATSKPSGRYRHIPAELRRAVWSRDRSRCTYLDPQSGRRCESTSFLEIDHIRPLALGGATTLDNLRLYCRTHNQFAAIQTYGESKIRRPDSH